MPLGWFDGKHHEPGEWTGFLEKGVRLEGKLNTVGTIRIDSAVKGSLSSSETLVLGENAVVEGEAAANHVIIGGRFDGVVRGKARVEIRAKAIVTGEIHTPCLVIEPGAVFDGRCHMLAPTTAQPAKTVTIPIRSAAAHA